MVRLLSGGPLTRRHARAHAVAIQAAERTAEAAVRAEKAAVAEAERAAEARVAADRQAELEAATEAANNQRAAAEALARRLNRLPRESESHKPGAVEANQKHAHTQKLKAK